MHRVKPNMAANGALIGYVSLSLTTRSFMFSCHVKTAQVTWNRRNSGPPWPPCLASLFARSATRRSHYIYIYIYGAHCSYLIAEPRRVRCLVIIVGHHNTSDMLIKIFARVTVSQHILLIKRGPTFYTCIARSFWTILFCSIVISVNKCRNK